MKLGNKEVVQTPLRRTDVPLRNVSLFVFTLPCMYSGRLVVEFVLLCNIF